MPAPRAAKRPAWPRLACLVLAGASLTGEARAQSFFEELFGIGRAAKPPVPPRGVPAEPAPVAPPPPSPGEPLPPEAARPSTPAPPRQPVVLRAPAEDNVMGQDLQLNGLAGTLRLERAGAAVQARIALPGTKVSQPAEACTVSLAQGSPLTLTAEGRPEGVARFEAAGAECPLRFDVWEGGVMVTAIGNATCTFTAADCATTPAGLWGPAAGALVSRAGEFDGARGVADKAVRDNFKILSQRMRGQDLRPVVQEQAAFSSEREQVCRTYAREGAHGFCNLRYTEARALSLAARLGANAATPTAAATPRPRRKPAVEGMNPDAGGAPAVEE